MAKVDFKEMMKAKVEAAQAKAEEKREEALLKLLDNDAFIESQRVISAKTEEVDHLNSIIAGLNSITPFVANDGRKFRVNVFPIAVFGTGLAQVMGIIAGISGAFVDEKAMEYAAITGVSQLELREAADALGRPAYFKDGVIHPAVEGDYSTLKELLQGIMLKLELREFTADMLTREKYDLYFVAAENRALRQLEEFNKMQELEEVSDEFTLE